MRFRELYLPEMTNNTALSVPSCVAGGHALALTGAQAGTATDGIRFPVGIATSYVDCGAIHSNVAKLTVHVRFKLTVPHAAGSASKYLFAKRVDADNLLYLYLDNGTGTLQWYLRIGAADKFTLASTAATWAADTWFDVIASLSDTSGGIQRLLVDGVAVDTDTQATANTPNGGNVLLGNALADTGSPLNGVISQVDIFTDDLTTAEETETYKGVPPLDVVNRWQCDEGTGLTLTDRGSGGNNGTMAAGVQWAYGRTRAALVSFDGINDRGISSSGVLIKEPCTMGLVIKTRTLYSGLSDYHNLARWFVDVDDEHTIYYEYTGDIIVFHTQGGTTGDVSYDATSVAIGSYLILMQTIDANLRSDAYVNGATIGYDAAIDAISAEPGIIYAATDNTAQDYDNAGQVLPPFIIDGAMSAAQVKAFSRQLDQIFNLGIGV